MHVVSKEHRHIVGADQKTPSTAKVATDDAATLMPSPGGAVDSAASGSNAVVFSNIAFREDGSPIPKQALGVALTDKSNNKKSPGKSPSGKSKDKNKKRRLNRL